MITLELPKILASVSKTENSVNGLKYAIKLAKAKNSELDLFHVVSSAEGKKNEFPYIKLIKEELQDKYKHTEIVREGKPAEQILNIASELEPELILMSPDVFNKEKKFFEESATGKVLEKSPYPVLMIPPNTEFKGISRILVGTEMEQNIIKSIQELLKIFKVLKPSVDIIIFSKKEQDWYFKEDVNHLMQNIKELTEYDNLTFNIADSKDIFTEMEHFARKTNTDLVCMENNVNTFYQLLFSSKTKAEALYLLNKPILILPNYWGDTLKNV